MSQLLNFADFLGFDLQLATPLNMHLKSRKNRQGLPFKYVNMIQKKEI